MNKEIKKKHLPIAVFFKTLGYYERDYVIAHGDTGYVLIARHKHYFKYKKDKKDTMVIYLRDVDAFESLNPPCKTCLVYPTCLKMVPGRIISSKRPSSGCYIQLQVCKNMLNFAFQKHIELKKKWEVEE